MLLVIHRKSSDYLVAHSKFITLHGKSIFTPIVDKKIHVFSKRIKKAVILGGHKYKIQCFTWDFSTISWILMQQK